MAHPDCLAAAIEHHQAGRLAEAEHLYRLILQADQNQPRVWHRLGVLLHQKGQHSQAAQHIEFALRLDAFDPEAHNNLGLVYQALGRRTTAALHHRRAIELMPTLAAAHSNLALCLQADGKLDEAAAACRRAISLNPEFTQAYYNLGRILKNQGNLNDAIACYHQALHLTPTFSDAWVNLGNALTQQGSFDEALDAFDRALAIAPFDAEAHSNRSHVLLLKGDFKSGWAEYEWRFETGHPPLPPFSQPRWQGESLAGKSIVLHAEQGLGDTLQFIRYAPLVKGLCRELIVHCPPSLLKLLQSMSSIDRLVAYGDNLPHFDVYTPLLSAARFFTTSLETIPAQVRYIAADPSLIKFWKDRLAFVQGLKIGINWHGRAGTGDFSKRNIPLSCFRSLLNIPTVRLISLQKGEGCEQLAAEINNGLPIVNLGNEFDTTAGAFMDTAAIMNNLDLIITSDTAIPHLAGALGVPVWLALPYSPDWRWLLNRSDSPWYPTMRLFRQPRPGDWDFVFTQMRVALKQVSAA